MTTVNHIDSIHPLPLLSYSFSSLELLSARRVVGPTLHESLSIYVIGRRRTFLCNHDGVAVGAYDGTDATWFNRIKIVISNNQKLREVFEVYFMCKWFRNHFETFKHIYELDTQLLKLLDPIS